ncbi:Uncharacterised protein [Yersinia pseudotuberculosis]|nr:Uncharacterised protein [Yersinia pseudotuberculosis]CNJ06080.1 Uncharacterised protein [Yersinia pseudotuberculosis]CNJ74537.1 Uncharacterised protein [Yersinia pseudotuberculosis]
MLSRILFLSILSCYFSSAHAELSCKPGSTGCNTTKGLLISKK